MRADDYPLGHPMTTLVPVHAPGEPPSSTRCGDMAGQAALVTGTPGGVTCPTCRALQHADDQAEDEALEARSRWAKAAEGDESAGELWSYNGDPWSASVWLSPLCWGLGILWDSNRPPAPFDQRRDYWTAQVGPLSFTIGKAVRS